MRGTLRDGTAIALVLGKQSNLCCRVRTPHVSNLKVSAVGIGHPIQSLLALLGSVSACAFRRSNSTEGGNEHSALRLVEHGAADRGVAEAFISDRFDSSFDARVEAFMPRLFSMRDQEGRICGAFGLRSTSCRLFVEQYLHLPIEAAIARCSGGAVERRSIVEVGHLSGTFPGAMRAMIVLLIAHLHREGFEWVAFTGTRRLRNAFARVGLFPVCLQPARIDSLPPATRAAWGRYYDHLPQVLVGRIRDGMHLLTNDSGMRGACL